jgi:hypothetical protein
MFVEFGKDSGLRIELSPHQNFYPDLTFVHDGSGRKFAIDIKTTYRIDDSNVNGMILGAFTVAYPVVPGSSKYGMAT